MRLYLAAPLFTAAELQFNLDMADWLTRAGHTVWLPQENSGLDDKIAVIFERNLLALDVAEAVVAVCDGHDVDSGTAWEVGYSYARCKPVFGVRSDYRRFSQHEIINLQVLLGLENLALCIDDLVENIRVYARPARS